jgi:Fe-S-cluster-containing dehydrogenase component
MRPDHFEPLANKPGTPRDPDGESGPGTPPTPRPAPRPRGQDLDRVREAAEAVGFSAELSRRGFLRLSAQALVCLAALGVTEGLAASPPLIIIENATGMLVADPARCVGCLRCELACTEFNDGRAQPSLSRIKVSRAVNFGPGGPTGGEPMHGTWGDGLVLQGVCRQCPHPVPCATACPGGAIIADPRTGTRLVDVKACIGCRLCQRSCPWGMMVFDEEAGRASKCFLCHGAPKCVAACPSEALRFAPWRDTTREAAAQALRVPVLAVTPPDTARACLDCHAPKADPKAAPPSTTGTGRKRP